MQGGGPGPAGGGHRGGRWRAGAGAGVKGRRENASRDRRCRAGDCRAAVSRRVASAVTPRRSGKEAPGPRSSSRGHPRLAPSEGHCERLPGRVSGPLPRVPSRHPPPLSLQVAPPRGPPRPPSKERRPRRGGGAHGRCHGAQDVRGGEAGASRGPGGMGGGALSSGRRLWQPKAWEERREGLGRRLQR